jgi:hypothetical protein
MSIRLNEGKFRGTKAAKPASREKSLVTRLTTITSRFRSGRGNVGYGFYLESLRQGAYQELATD